MAESVDLAMDAESSSPADELVEMPTTVCTVCTHPQAAEIDAGLLGGTPLRTIAGTFGLSRSAVGRHRQNHLSVQTITEPEPSEHRKPLRMVDVHGQLTGLCDRLEKVVELSTRTRKPAAAVQAMREQRQALEAIARIQTDPKLTQAAVISEMNAKVAEGMADWMVALIDFLATTAGLKIRDGVWPQLVAACFRSMIGEDGQDREDYRRSDFSKVDTSEVSHELERAALDAAARMETEVQRRVEAELRRREQQARPALEAREVRAIEGGAAWSA